MDVNQTIGQYQVLEEIAHGSTTTVYKAYQPNLRRTVLIKKLHQKLVLETDIRERFFREAQVCAKISHPNIVPVYDFRSDPELAYIVLEFIHGSSLAELISKEPLPLFVAVYIILEILKGLEFAHEQGVVHRDLKPDNILISSDGQVKITDFGLAALEGATTLTRQGMVVGTPAYMSPEQAAGKKVEKQSDIFSLGITFFEMLTGVNVYRGDSLTECIRKILSDPPPKLSDYRTDMPVQLEKLLNKMLQKNSAKRISSCSEIFDELSQIAQDFEPKPDKKLFIEFLQKRGEYQSSAITISTSTAKRRNRFFRTGVLAAVMCVIILVFMIWQPLSRKEATISSADSTQIFANLDSAQSLQEPQTGDDNQGTSGDINSQIPEEKNPIVIPESTHIKKENIKPGNKIIPNEESVSHQQDTSIQQADYIISEENITLPSEPGQLSITCYPWADVYLDDKLLGQPPFGKSFPVEPGKHTLYFIRQDYPLVSKQIDIESGKKLSVDMKLWEHLGLLKISTVNTWAEIWIDGELVDKTPRADPLVLSLGKHKIELKNPDFKTWVKEIEFTKGTIQPEILTVNLETRTEGGEQKTDDR